MQDLRLVGVHDDGEHLLLSGTGGEMFRLHIDEALRAASARSPYRAADRPPSNAAADPATRLSPRDIQARIRSGATAEQIAEESGLDLAHIERYDGPVRAERAYIAEQAQQANVSTPLPTHDGHRTAFGDEPATLFDMVTHRLGAFGLDPAAVFWDAWRRPDGSWNLVAEFEASSEAAADVDEKPPAQWIFDAVRKTVSNGNRWAQLLSELEPLDGPLQIRRLSAVADRVFDFEAGGENSGSAPATEEIDSDNLLDVLRSRRGQRLGDDEQGDDALALMLSRGAVPAAHPRTDADNDNANEQGAHRQDDDERDGAGQEGAPGGSGAESFPVLSLAPSYPDEHDGPYLHDGVSTRTREISISSAPWLRSTERPEGPHSANEHAADGHRSAGRGSELEEELSGNNREAGTTNPENADDEHPDRKQIKPKRSSIPSWDEIVFGTKSE